MTWFCFTKAVELFHSVLGRGSDGLPCDWWDYPFIPVFGYFITTLIAALATDLIVQNCVENILDTLRSAGAINF